MVLREEPDSPTPATPPPENPLAPTAPPEVLDALGPGLSDDERREAVELAFKKRKAIEDDEKYARRVQAGLNEHPERLQRPRSEEQKPIHLNGASNAYKAELRSKGFRITGKGRKLVAIPPKTASSAVEEPPPSHATAPTSSSSPPAAPDPPKAKEDRKNWEDGVRAMEKDLETAEEAAKVGGVWQTDGSRHALAGKVKPDNGSFTVTVPALRGRPVLKVAYFFSGVSRKASVSGFLKKWCEDAGFGLVFYEVDILVGGDECDLMDRDTQDEWIARVEAGEFDVVINSPPCGTWSRANWANLDGPAPCRNRQNPWGFPNNEAHQRRRAEAGNEFIHFTLRAIAAAQAANAKGKWVGSLWEHPEDLGAQFHTPHKGIGNEPASV